MISVKRARYCRSESTVRSRGGRYPIVLGIRPGAMVLTFRLLKHRQEYSLPVHWCFVQAVEAHIEAERERKRAARKAARKGGLS
jgi:hypothetical protein